MEIIEQWIEANVYPIPSKGFKYFVWMVVGVGIIAVILLAMHSDYQALVTYQIN